MTLIEELNAIACNELLPRSVGEAAGQAAEKLEKVVDAYSQYKILDRYFWDPTWPKTINDQALRDLWLVIKEVCE